MIPCPSPLCRHIGNAPFCCCAGRWLESLCLPSCRGPGLQWPLSPSRDSAPADREVWGDIIQPSVASCVRTHPPEALVHQSFLLLLPGLSGTGTEKSQWNSVFLGTVLSLDSLVSSHALPINRPLRINRTLCVLLCGVLPVLFSAKSLQR